MDKDSIKDYVYETFNNVYLPSLKDYLRIPNLSPAYDKDWKKNGYLKQAGMHLRDFALQQATYFSVNYLEGENTPLLYIFVPSTNSTIEENVLLYGHFDKQPWGDNWDEDKKPNVPIVENDRLYGRGSADDGYSMYAFLLSIVTIRQMGGSHPKIHILIEGGEESGSPDMNKYLKLLSVLFFLFRKL
jgi:acetylornithine deacetylase/succinyl-diaminopimelate desuccinylase-like protein